MKSRAVQIFNSKSKRWHTLLAAEDVCRRLNWSNQPKQPTTKTQLKTDTELGERMDNIKKNNLVHRPKQSLPESCKPVNNK